VSAWCSGATSGRAGRRPTAAPASRSEAFVGSLFFIAFAFSGWNAAAYAASEFQQPEKDVPRAMLIGCALVAVLYLLVNWVFVANLTPNESRAVFEYETKRVTLGHLVIKDLLGEAGGSRCRSCR
jgi:APA family basic amino acid/polyamine antiporter